jgi:hypothetical protein
MGSSDYEGCDCADQLSLVRHELKGLVFARLSSVLRAADKRRFRELCTEERALLAARPHVLSA